MSKVSNNAVYSQPPAAREPLGMWDLYVEYLREHHKLPEGWRLFRIQSHFGVTGTEVFDSFDGAVPGKQDATRRTIWAKNDDVVAWINHRINEMGLCARCFGAGRIPTGWFRSSGNRYVVCETCAGDGLHHLEEKR